ncbi:MAG: bifunctional (p)ppGpp synthetase/guanosine-3',5'-bis(diphosphate) 3'-pyrophosphohydrolase [Coriobacteriales bacterium]|jgi:GTP pyrophosphokinase|nr:bifunctional (p)ppGpp synthetase/guanosine-3',5'-bis(diphosphate) 3'-pyrophosphohydrolase [Coriobacteriales bacterium]
MSTEKLPHTIDIGAGAVVRPLASTAELLQQLFEACETYMGTEELKQVHTAFAFANEAHAGQMRKGGEPFISHPVQVALILAELRMDVDTITAAVLHDTVEDCSVELSDLAQHFSEDVLHLVDGVTKITRIEIESLTEQQAKNIRKMLVAMSRDIRVIVIKLADRLHNMRTLGALREDRQIFKARETMEIYAPLAHRLGINSIKWELEDLSFYYLDRMRFGQIQRMVAESRDARERYLNDTIAQLGNELEKLGVEAKITGRPKHLYSIYQKMTEKGKDFNEIYDLIALRVIVEDETDCYRCLGAAHALWRPMPGRFKDYIGMPKFNMYQSLHTTVIGPAARPLEIQIRTKEMHRTSEYGVAAHWRYKEGRSHNGLSASKQESVSSKTAKLLKSAKRSNMNNAQNRSRSQKSCDAQRDSSASKASIKQNKKNNNDAGANVSGVKNSSSATRTTESFDAVFDEQLLWLRQILDWADDADDPKEFLASFKRDLSYSEVFVFTPKGEVVNLRVGSTPIDFAYAIHTEVGNHCVGAKVNANIVPLSYELQMGDRVEILSQKSSGPSRDWLNIVKTPSARQKIRNYLSKVNRSDDILKGRDLLAREMRKHGLGISSQRSVRAIKEVCAELKLSNSDDLFAQIGAGKARAVQITNKLLKILIGDLDAEAAVERRQDLKQGIDALDKLTSAMLAGQDRRKNQRGGIGILDATSFACDTDDFVNDNYGTLHRGIRGSNTSGVGNRGQNKKSGEIGIIVKGLDGVLVRLARCCNPVPGDDIIGFVTRGRGVSVHRTNCPDAKQLMQSPERIIDVQWEGIRSVYLVDIFVEAIDRLHLLADVTVVLANNAVNILRTQTESHRDGIVDMRFHIEMSETDNIEHMLLELRAVDGVIGARRTLPGEAIRRHRDFRP